MYDKLKKFIELLQEVEKKQTLDLSDPEDLRKFELKWGLLHKSEERFIKGAKLLLEEKGVE